MNTLLKKTTIAAAKVALDKQLDKHLDKLDRLDNPTTRRIRDKVLEVADHAPDRREVKQKAKVASAAAAVKGRRARKQVGETVVEVRESKMIEAVIAAVGAALPFVTSALSRRSVRRSAKIARHVAPVVVRTHPVLTIFAAIGGAVALTAAVRAFVQRRAAVAAPAPPREDVSRWEGEGGDPGGAAATAVSSAPYVRNAGGGGPIIESH